MAITDRKTGSVADIALIPACSDTTAPTVAEITAGDRLECYIVDSIDTPRSGRTTDISSLCERETYNIATTVENGDITATLWREFDGTDTAWTALDDTAATPVTQYLVVCRGGFSGTAGAPATGDNVDVYTVQVSSRSPEPPTKTEAQRFSVTLACLGVEFDATVS